MRDADFARFVAAKRAQAQELAGAQTNHVPPMVWKFFDAVAQDHWRTATNRFRRLCAQSGRFPEPSPSILATIMLEIGRKLGLSDRRPSALNIELWAPISEALGAYEQFHDWDSKWLHRFGHDTIEPISTNSIYFGGTDPGRFVVSALSESHRKGRPFFTLTQNQLADTTYFELLADDVRQPA